MKMLKRNFASELTGILHAVENLVDYFDVCAWN